MTALAIEKIDIRKDARAIDAATVAGLAESIASVGLINPIRVRQIGDRFEVIAGAHRLSAVRQIGHDTIEAVVVDDDDLHAELAMIDENLCRSELSPSDRAKQTARRKAIYLQLHPETSRESTLKQGTELPSRQVGETGTAGRFTAATATVTGQSERSIQRDAERGEKVTPEVMDMVRGTKLDTGTYLDKLKKLAPNDQVAAAKRDLVDRRPSESERKPSRSRDTDEAQTSRLLKEWDAASAKARRDFLKLAKIEPPTTGQANAYAIATGRA